MPPPPTTNLNLSKKAALKLSTLLFCRSGELRHMKWLEIDSSNIREPVFNRNECREGQKIMSEKVSF